MPLNLTVLYGLTPTDLHASIRWLVMLLWPHPLQSVEGSPWKATVGRVRLWPLLWIVDRRFAGHDVDRLCRGCSVSRLRLNR